MSDNAAQHAESVSLSEADLLAAFEHIESLPRTYSPSPIVMHPNEYARFKARGWITEDGRIDWRKVAADTVRIDGEAGA